MDCFRKAFSASSMLSPYRHHVRFVHCEIELCSWGRIELTLVTRKQMFILERALLSGTILYASGWASSAA